MKLTKKDSRSRKLKTLFLILLFLTTAFSNIWLIDTVRAARVESIDVEVPEEVLSNSFFTVTYSIDIYSESHGTIEVILEEEATHYELSHSIFPIHGSSEDPITSNEGALHVMSPPYPPEDLPLTINLNLLVKEGDLTLETYPISIRIVGEMEYYARILELELDEEPVYAGNEFTFDINAEMTLPTDTEIEFWVDKWIEGEASTGPILEHYFQFPIAISDVVDSLDVYYVASSSDTPYVMIIEAELRYRLPGGDWQTDGEPEQIRVEVELADFSWASITHVDAPPAVQADEHIALAIHIEHNFIEEFVDEEIQIQVTSYEVGFEETEYYDLSTGLDTTVYPEHVPARADAGPQTIIITLEIFDGTDWTRPGGESYYFVDVNVGLHDPEHPERISVRVTDVTVHDPVRVRTPFMITVDFEYYVEIDTQAFIELELPPEVIPWEVPHHPFMLPRVDPAEESVPSAEDMLVLTFHVPDTPGTYTYGLALSRHDIDEGWVIDEGAEFEFEVEVTSDIGELDGEEGTALMITGVTKSEEVTTPPFDVPANFRIGLDIHWTFENPTLESHDVTTFICEADSDILSAYTRLSVDDGDYQSPVGFFAPSTALEDWPLQAYAIIYDDVGDILYWDSMDFTLNVVEVSEDAYIDWVADRLLWSIDGIELAFEAELSVADTNLGYPQESQVIFSIDGVPLGGPQMAIIGEGEPFTRVVSDGWTPALGPHTLRVEVESIPPEVESNPDDNVLELLFNVGSGMPDMPPAPPYDAPSDFDFSISIDPSMKTIESGEEAIFPVDVSLVSGEPASVSLELNGLPAEASYIFDQPTGTPGFNTNLRIAVSDSVVADMYMLSVEGQSAEVTHSALLTLIVEDSPDRPDFALTVMPETIRINQGEEDEVRISVHSERGYDRMVSLDVLGLPTGVTDRLSQSAGTPNYAPTLTLTVGENVAEGEYLVTIVASGSGTRQGSVRLNVGEAEAVTPEGISIANYATPILGILVLAAIGASAVWLIRRRKPGKPKKPAKIPRKITGYCIECGASIHADDEFCPKCGESQKGKS
ncbi:MAG: hypothetical protein NWF08_07470 [Candidatus Bathyarchaeota archaeon]|nr:hypothetical protein [Candidatus Bathyarchaeota archaeon]